MFVGSKQKSLFSKVLSSSSLQVVGDVLFYSNLNSISIYLSIYCLSNLVVFFLFTYEQKEKMTKTKTDFDFQFFWAISNLYSPKWLYTKPESEKEKSNNQITMSKKNGK